jgi:glycine/D-amino acid oxidase-like deaminating enzyme
MKTTTRVAIIGGGVVGCSVLYHLTKLGWSDVMLLERSELDLWIHLACGRRFPYTQWRYKYGSATGLHHQALQRA